jgi:hypothetical protein
MDAIIDEGWERLVRIEAIKELKANVYTAKQAMDRKQADDLFNSFASVSKQFVTDFFDVKDERKKPRKTADNSIRDIKIEVSFPKRTIGSLRLFFNRNTDNILSEFRNIFDKALYGNF